MREQFQLHRGVVQVGRTPALGAGGRRFESCHSDISLGG